MYKKLILIMALSFTMLATTGLFAQEWSPAQKKVWKNVEAYWSLAAKGDIEGFLTYFHSDFSGWVSGSHLPHDRAAREKFIRFYFPRNETLFYDINPLAITIHGNVAIVHYSYTEVSKDTEGKENSEQGHWTDILMKQGDKWVMIGDHGGSTSGN